MENGSPGLTSWQDTTGHTQVTYFHNVSGYSQIVFADVSTLNRTNGWNDFNCYKSSFQGEKKFVCPICEKRFMRSDHLNKHARRHPEFHPDMIKRRAGATTPDSRTVLTPPATIGTSLPAHSAFVMNVQSAGHAIAHRAKRPSSLSDGSFLSVSSPSPLASPSSPTRDDNPFTSATCS